MKKSRILTVLVTAIAALGIAGSAAAANLNDNDKQFLSNYEKVRAGLAGDSLDQAKTAAREMGDEGKAIADAENIKAARKEFEKLSSRAIDMAKGQDGYYVANCPMLKKDWVQTSKEISNPYAGSSMPTCGVIKK
jgi:hypothetical protein